MRIIYVLVSTVLIAGAGVLALAGIGAQHASQLAASQALLKAEAARLDQTVAMESRRAARVAAQLALDPALVLDLRTLSTLATPPPFGKMPEPRRLRVDALRSKLTAKLSGWKAEHQIDGVALLDAGGRVLAADGTMFKAGTRLKVAAPATAADSEAIDFAEEGLAGEEEEEEAPVAELDPRLTLTAFTGAAQQAALVEAGALRFVGVSALPSKAKPVGGVLVQVTPASLPAARMFVLADGKVVAGKAPPGLAAAMPETSEPFLLLPQPAHAQVPGLGTWPLGPLFVPRTQIGTWAQRITVPGVGSGAVFADLTPRYAELAGMQMLVLLALLVVVAAHVIILLLATRRAEVGADVAAEVPAPAAAADRVPLAPPPPPPDAELEFEGISNAGSMESSSFDLKTGEIAGSHMQSLLAETEAKEPPPHDTAPRPAVPMSPVLDEETQVIAAEPDLTLEPAAADSGFDVKTDTRLAAPPALELSRVDDAETQIVTAPHPPPVQSLALEESTPVEEDVVEDVPEPSARDGGEGPPALDLLPSSSRGSEPARFTPEALGELDDVAATARAAPAAPAAEPADTALFAEPLGAFAGDEEDLTTEAAAAGPAKSPTPAVVSKAPEASPAKPAAPKPPESAAPKPPESAAPKPSESAAPKPPESAVRKPPESAVRKPPESAAPKPSESAVRKPSESAAPKPPSVAAAFAASLAAKPAVATLPGDAPTLVTSRPESAPAKPVAPAKPAAPVARPSAPAPAPQSKPGSGENAGFRKVFDEFVATRKKCGENTADLTFEKFSAKLVASRDAVMAKHNCSEVRFEVYVKDGKAALKALPAR